MIDIKYYLHSILFITVVPAYAQSKLPITRHQFIIIAHRGDHTEAPENTILAFKNAIKSHADYIEVDLRTTKDSQLVVMHDENLIRMTGVDRKISEWPLDSLMNTKIKDPYHPEWGIHDIPTFENVLKTARGRINIYLDFKNASVPRTMQLLEQYKMTKKTIVYINNSAQFQEWRSLVPDMPLILSLPPHLNKSEDIIKFITVYKPDLLDGSYTDYTEEMILVAEQLNVKICPDIQSENENIFWPAAARLHFYGLQTDHPRALYKFIRNKNRF